jgi:ribosome-associated protein
MYKTNLLHLFLFAIFSLPKTAFGFGVLPQLTRIVLQRNSALSSSPSTKTNNEQDNPILCDLQTFLRFATTIQSGGEAKAAIQGGQCFLNGQVETRRAKKLYKGDEVFFDGVSLDVLDEVLKNGYKYTPKKKKVKPVAKIDENGKLEFGGRYRSEEWRAERKEKKAERKRNNSKKN